MQYWARVIAEQEADLAKRCDFEKLPYPIRKLIFLKFTFQQFSKFEQLSEYSFGMCNKYRKVSFPFRTNSLEISVYADWPMEPPKFMIWGVMRDKIPISRCAAQMHFSLEKLAISECLTEPVYNFICEKVSKTSQLSLCVPEEECLYLKNVIEKLKPSEVEIGIMKLYENEFPYDMSNISKVSVTDYERRTPAKKLLSIAAKDELQIKNGRITTEHVVVFIKDLMSKSAPIVKTTICSTVRLDIQKLKRALLQLKKFIVEERKGLWLIGKMGENKPFMKITCDGYNIEFVEC